MSFKDIKKNLGKLTTSRSSTKIIFVIGIIGIVLIALSSIGSGDKSKEAAKSAENAPPDIKAEEYKDQITDELENILQKIDGVGDCCVMLSVEGTAEYVFAENVDKTQEYASGGSNEHYRSEIVMIDSGSKQALVTKTLRPKINGVVVVCQGGGNVTVKERVIKAVSAALDLPYGKICVEGKTN